MIERCIYNILHDEYMKHKTENQDSGNFKLYFEELMSINKSLQDIETNILRILDQICTMNKALLKYKYV